MSDSSSLPWRSSSSTAGSGVTILAIFQETRAAFAGAPYVNLQATLCSSELRRLSVLLLSPRVIDASLELSG